MRRIDYKLISKRSIRLFGTVLLIGVGLFYFSQARAANFPQRSLIAGSAQSGATTTYTLSFTVPAPETLGSIKLEICANSPLVGDPCTAPAGFDISGASLTAQSGETGFSILSSATTTNSLILTRPAAAAAAIPVSYTFDTVVNPTAVGTYFGRLQTFASIDGTGPNNDYGGLALSINAPVNISTYVPPYLLFCTGVTITGFDCANASGDYVNFGTLSNLAPSTATTQMLTATNAGSGFNINVYGTTMVSGNNLINNIAAADVSRPGTSQFGMNLVANTTPSVGSDPQGGGSAAPASGYNTPNFYKFVPGDVVASNATTDAYRLFTVSYLVNVPKSQPVGVYVATLTYICLANF